MEAIRILALIFVVCTGISYSSSSPDLEPNFVGGDNPPSLPSPIIRNLHITSDIKFTYANTSVFSKILNPADKAQEVTFRVVLPEEAFITGLKLTIKDKSYDAYVKGKEEAKKEYDTAVSSGQTAAHVFQENTRNSKDFTVAVNVEPLEKVSFNLTYEELLSRKNRTYKNEINVNPNQIVPDLQIVVNIEDVLNIKNVYVPEFRTSNEIDLNEHENELAKQTVLAPNKVRIEWKPTPEEQRKLNKNGLNGQMIVKYDVDASYTPQQVIVGSDGYFIHTLRYDDLPVLNKHVVFVLDVSGSMYGQKLEQLRDAMKKILQDLSESDHFSIVLFSVKVIAWEPSSNPDLESLNSYNDLEPANVIAKEEYVIPANKENVQKALEFITTLSSYGGTNIMGGLRNGLKLAQLGQKLSQKSPQESMIIFLTDGQPNSEESNPDKIIENVGKQNEGNVTIFSLGFGFDLDFPFMKKLSIANGGFSRRIYPDSDASLQLQNFYKEVASPVLSDVHFNYLPGQVENITVTTHKNLFSGSDIVVLGRVKPDGKLTGALSAISRNGTENFEIPIDKIICLPTLNISRGENKTHGYLEKMWAYKTIKTLLDKYEVSKNESFKNQSLDLALKYSFVTPLTSLVVVKPNDSSLVSDEEGRPTQGFGLMKYNAQAFNAGGLPAYTRTRGGVAAIGLSAYPMRGHSGMPGSFAMQMAGPPMASQAKTTYDLYDATALIAERDEVDVSTTMNPPPEDLHYSNVTWLNQTEVTSDEGSYLVPPDSLKTTDVIALNQTDVVSGQCQNGRNCRHFIHCILEEFVDDIDKFIPYQCHFAPKYLGVCCPH